MIHSLSRCRAAFVAAVAITILQGCAGLGLEKPKSFKDDYAYALGQITAVRQAATTALDARQITIADAQYALQLTDQSRQYLESARTVAEAGDELKGKSQLALATTVLTKLQAYLNARAPK